MFGEIPGAVDNMIPELKTYANMRDSGLPWLGGVPIHWEVRRTKSLLTRNDSGSWGSDFDDSGIIVLRSTEQRPDGEWNIVEPARRRLNNFEYLANRLEEGDLLVTKSSGSTLHIGKTSIVTQAVAALDCCFSNFMQRLRVKQDTYPRFMWYALNGELGRRQFGYYSDTTTGLANINAEVIGRITVPHPPLPEQMAIVRFLDHADRRIRRYIRAKQKLIALLEEQKQAIIHQAVTGQIDVRGGQPYPAYKPSGVEWLGDVPAHWEVIALRRKWRVIDCKHLTVPFVDEGIPLASVREAQSFELDFKTSNHTTAEWYEKLIEGGREPRVGDLIYCRNVSVGAAALVETEDRFAMGQDVCLIRSSTENQRWLNYFLRSNVMSHQLAFILVGSTFSRINVADVKALLIGVPPGSEQDQIAAFLDQELSKIGKTVDNCRGEQALLEEYRTCLIADVVTGKLDVREAVTSPPEVDPLATEDGVDETFADVSRIDGEAEPAEAAD